MQIVSYIIIGAMVVGSLAVLVNVGKKIFIDVKKAINKKKGVSENSEGSKPSENSDI